MKIAGIKWKQPVLVDSRLEKSFVQLLVELIPSSVIIENAVKTPQKIYDQNIYMIQHSPLRDLTQDAKTPIYVSFSIINYSYQLQYYSQYPRSRNNSTVQ